MPIYISFAWSILYLKLQSKHPNLIELSCQVKLIYKKKILKIKEQTKFKSTLENEKKNSKCWRKI